jgi:NAD(P)-dependent dehydrogenase (short-subunit alcohol dehydrogenase family)
MASPVALITGAGRGIGRAAALALAHAGYRLALVSRTRDELEQTAQLAAPNSNALIFPADVSDPDRAATAVERTIQELGRLDALVNVAGAAPVRSVEAMTPHEWRTVIDTNVSAVFYLSKFAWPHLRNAAHPERPSAIVNISSLASRDPFTGFAAYGAAKAALNLFGLAAAREGQPHNILVHTIAPGAVETEMFRQIMTPDQYPAERCLTPAEVADLILQCATGRLRHLSGEVIWMHKTL